MAINGANARVLIAINGDQTSFIGILASLPCVPPGKCCFCQNVVIYILPCALTFYLMTLVFNPSIPLISGIVQRRTEPYVYAAAGAQDGKFGWSTADGAAAEEPLAPRWSSALGLTAPAPTPRAAAVRRPAVALQLSAVLGKKSSLAAVFRESGFFLFQVIMKVPFQTVFFCIPFYD
jgi:hypothetical protein